jgi:hypothetical protein
MAVFARRDPGAFYQAVQEDGALEWATFWAFFSAALAFARGAVAARGRARAWLVALAAFAAFIALEEISWGQRVLRYRAPVYFLEHNFQQELNLHNVASKAMREWLWVVLLGGWGVAIPLLARVPALREVCDRLALQAPPLALAPAFAAALALQLSYPLPFTGELVELLFGALLLFVALARARPATALRAWSGALAVVGVAAIGSAAWSSHRPAAPAAAAAAFGELEALAGDFTELARMHGPPTDCNLHKRIYTFVVEYGVPELTRMRFAALAGANAAPERITYFLDPWNSPYWVRDQCAARGRRRAVFVYSFGPNQRRDSSAWRLGGDDIGVYLVRPRAAERRGAAG